MLSNENTEQQNKDQENDGEATTYRFRSAKQMSKNELARKFVSAARQLEQWTEVAMALASYYINIEPHAPVFTGTTFSPNTLEKIKERALLALKDTPYSMIVYVVDREDPTKKFALPVDVVDVTDREQWDQLFDRLNTERDHQLNIDRTDPPADCVGCLFGTSCGESMVTTGLRVYNCGQYAPNIKKPSPHKPDPRTLEHHPDDPAADVPNQDQGDGDGKE